MKDLINLICHHWNAILMKVMQLYYELKQVLLAACC